MKASVYVSKKCFKSLNSAGQWVYDNEIDRVDGEYENGDIVKVKDLKDRVIGLGFINDNSKIRVRLFTRDKKAEVNAGFFKKRLADAWEYRKNVIDTGCCRIVFGEADFLPGLTIDKFSDVLVVQSLALGIDRYKELIVQTLIDILRKDGIEIRGVYERSEAQVRKLEGMEPKKGFIGKEFDTSSVLIKENGVLYSVDVENGQKTGFFLDQKLNRKAVSELCKGKTVLDCFTHTGSFALNACLGGASEVTAVDVSEAALETAKKNAMLNGCSDKINFVCADVFELLPRQISEGKKYDVVILDPPAFTKSRSSIEAAVRGYKEINIRGMRLVKNGGYFATCSCSHFMGDELFRSLVHEASVDTGVYLRQIEVRAQSPDHPVIWGSSESYYLKFFIFQVFTRNEV